MASKAEMDRAAKAVLEKLQEAERAKAEAARVVEQQEALRREELARKIAAEERSARFAGGGFGREPDDLDREMEAAARTWAQAQTARLAELEAETAASAERARRKLAASAASAYGWARPDELGN